MTTDRKVMTPAAPLLVGAAITTLDLARRLLRERHLFAPERDAEVSWDPAAYGLPGDRVREVWIPAGDGRQLYAWHCRSPQPIASALFCHGNRGNITTDAHLVRYLVDAGLDILAFDYRGFGRSEGRPSPRGLVADAQAAAEMHDQLRRADLPSILYGFSLGGAVAAQAAKRHRFDGVVLQSTFTNLRDVARLRFPRLPMHLLAGRTFDTLAAIRGLETPLLIVHGKADEAIPHVMANSLFEACAGPKWLTLVDNALHRTVHEQGRSLSDAVRAFALEIGALKRDRDNPR